MPQTRVGVQVACFVSHLKSQNRREGGGKWLVTSSSSVNGTQRVGVEREKGNFRPVGARREKEGGESIPSASTRHPAPDRQSKGKARQGVGYHPSAPSTLVSCEATLVRVGLLNQDYLQHSEDRFESALSGRKKANRVREAR